MISKIFYGSIFLFYSTLPFASPDPLVKLPNDLVLISDEGTEHPCNREFLIQHSKYFSTMFQSKFSEYNQDRIELANSSAGIDWIIHFFRHQTVPPQLPAPLYFELLNFSIMSLDSQFQEKLQKVMVKIEPDELETALISAINFQDGNSLAYLIKALVDNEDRELVVNLIQDNFSHLKDSLRKIDASLFIALYIKYPQPFLLKPDLTLSLVQDTFLKMKTWDERARTIVAKNNDIFRELLLTQYERSLRKFIEVKNAKDVYALFSAHYTLQILWARHSKKITCSSQLGFYNYALKDVFEQRVEPRSWVKAFNHSYNAALGKERVRYVQEFPELAFILSPEHAEQLQKFSRALESNFDNELFTIAYMATPEFQKNIFLPVYKAALLAVDGDQRFNFSMKEMLNLIAQETWARKDLPERFRFVTLNRSETEIIKRTCTCSHEDLEKNSYIKMLKRLLERFSIVAE